MNMPEKSQVESWVLEAVAVRSQALRQVAVPSRDGVTNSRPLRSQEDALDHRTKRKAGQCRQFHRPWPASGWSWASRSGCTVDASLGAVAHGATAQLGLLVLIPAPFTEVREEGRNLSTGRNHRVRAMGGVPGVGEAETPTN